MTRWSIVIALVLATVVLATPLVVRLRDARASSFRSRFTRDRDALLARPTGGNTDRHRVGPGRLAGPRRSR